MSNLIASQKTASTETLSPIDWHVGGIVVLAFILAHPRATVQQICEHVSIIFGESRENMAPSVYAGALKRLEALELVFSKERKERAGNESHYSIWSVFDTRNVLNLLSRAHLELCGTLCDWSNNEIIVFSKFLLCCRMKIGVNYTAQECHALVPGKSNKLNLLGHLVKEGLLGCSGPMHGNLYFLTEKSIILSDKIAMLLVNELSAERRSLLCRKEALGKEPNQIVINWLKRGNEEPIISRILCHKLSWDDVFASIRFLFAKHRDLTPSLLAMAESIARSVAEKAKENEPWRTHWLPCLMARIKSLYEQPVAF